MLTYHLAPHNHVATDTHDIQAHLPNERGTPDRPHPTVLRVHGGPWRRDSWRFNAEAQWLASRGYFVLCVNYRGSTGLGKHLLNSGNQAWGSGMQDDLVDAIDWGIEQGYIDPNAIAIMGGSYGGFAALLAVCEHPALFRCAVTCSAITSLPNFIASIPPYWKPMQAMLRNRVGDISTNTGHQELTRISPLDRVDDIQVPVLLAHGQHDPRVSYKESLSIHTALKSRRIDSHLLIFRDEGHGIDKENNRYCYYAAVERFLYKNIGGLPPHDHGTFGANVLESGGKKDN